MPLFDLKNRLNEHTCELGVSLTFILDVELTVEFKRNLTRCPRSPRHSLNQSRIDARENSKISGREQID